MEIKHTFAETCDRLADKIPVSVFVITLNESHNIGRLLGSVSEFDEIILVDANSTDETVSIAKAIGAVVYRHDWRGYEAQKGLAMSYCSNDWVLNLDADEVATPEMKNVIRQVIKRKDIDGVRFKRNDRFIGRFMPNGINIPNTIRLYRKDKASFDDGRYVHERAAVAGREFSTKAQILHYGYDCLDVLMAKHNKYSGLRAQEKFDAKIKPSRLKLAVTLPLEFLRKYVAHRFMFFGWRGLILSTMIAYYAFMKEAKLHDKYMRVQAKSEDHEHPIPKVQTNNELD